MGTKITFLANYLGGGRLHIFTTLLISFLSFIGFGQTFTNNTSVNLSSASATSVSSCPPLNTAGLAIVNITVSGVGTLTNTGSNELKEIQLSLNGGNRGITNSNMLCYLVAPNGTCMQLYSSAGNNYTTNTNTSNYVFKNSTENCLTVNNIYPSGYTFQNINNAPSFFSPTGGVIIREHFKTVNADGVWKLVFCSSSSFSQNRHNFVSASLIFGTGVLDHEVRTTESGLCANGIGAFQWYGTASCLNNQAGKVSADQTADSKVYPGHNPGGCEWNNENNYTTWIKFTPTKTPVTITVQGNDDPYKRLQTIVLKPTNTSIDPCTSASNVSWSVVSCPRNSIYTTSAGTEKSQTHTFNVSVGEDYYLAVDGTGLDANSNFTLSGDIGVQNPLPVELLDFSANCNNNNYIFEWATGSETNNDFFTIQHSVNGTEWTEVAIVAGNGTVSNKSRYKHEVRAFYEDKVNYFRLVQTDYNGEQKILKTVSLVGCIMENIDFEVIPNPNNGKFSIMFRDYSEVSSVQVIDLLGRVLFSENLIANNLAMNINESKGVYVVVVQYKSGKKETKKVVVR